MEDYTGGYLFGIVAAVAVIGLMVSMTPSCAAGDYAGEAIGKKMPKFLKVNVDSTEDKTVVISGYVKAPKSVKLYPYVKIRWEQKSKRLEKVRLSKSNTFTAKHTYNSYGKKSATVTAYGKMGRRKVTQKEVVKFELIEEVQKEYETIAGFLDELTAGNIDEFELVVGVQAHAEEVIAIVNFATWLNSFGINVPAIKLDTEIENPKEINLIAIGSECKNNVITELFDGASCDEIHYQCDNRAQIFNNNGKGQLVIATEKNGEIRGFTNSVTQYQENREFFEQEKACEIELIEDYCEDSDGEGLDTKGLVKGTIRWVEDEEMKETTDFCWADTGLLGEWWCDSETGHAMRSNYDCSKDGKVCEDGRCVEETGDDSYMIGTSDDEYLMLGDEVGDVEVEVTGDELGIFADGVFDYNVDSTAYTQKLVFENTDNTGSYLFTADESNNNLAGQYFVIEDSSGDYLYNYQLRFNEPISNVENLGYTTILLQGKSYTITEATTSGNKLNKIKLSNDIMEYTFEDGQEIKINDVHISDITNAYAKTEFVFEGNNWKGFDLKLRANQDEVFMVNRDEYVDPVFGNFKFTFGYPGVGGHDLIKLQSEVMDGYLQFKNKDDKTIRLDMVAKDGVGTEVRWGTKFDDEDIEDKIYFHRDICNALLKSPQSTIVDCVGAKFLVLKDDEAHLMQITDIDLVDMEIDFKDLTYGVEDRNNNFEWGENAFALAGGTGIITLNMVEDNKIIFKDLNTGDEGTWGCWDNKYGYLEASGDPVIGTRYGSKILLWEESNREGIGFSWCEKQKEGAHPYIPNAHDGQNYLGIWDTEIEYDENDDNRIEFYPDPITSQYGFDFIAVDDENNDDQVAMSYKGTEIKKDADDQSYVMIIHPRMENYAKLTIISIP